MGHHEGRPAQCDGAAVPAGTEELDVDRAAAILLTGSGNRALVDQRVARPDHVGEAVLESADIGGTEPVDGIGCEQTGVKHAERDQAFAMLGGEARNGFERRADLAGDRARQGVGR